jgi:diguanylate cyclase (GGDEF)-like protein
MNQKDLALTAKNMLFQGMDFASVEYMLEHCSIRELQEGEELLRPDTPNNHLYLVVDGELNVELVAQKTLRHTSLGVGECAGEISLVDGKLPSALVVAAKPGRVLAIPHDTVWSLVDHSHEVARNLLSIIAGRMRNDNHALIHSQNKRAQVEHQATVDALTGVHNRHWMSDAFPRTMQRCIIGQQPIAILVADIDHFKKVNDTYGHLMGDLALKTVAASMAQQLRPHDLLVRYGGEEFVMLLPDTDTEEARQIAERLRIDIEGSEIERKGIRFRVTISIGIAPARKDLSLETLIEEADCALYRAKELGRNRVEIFA